MPSPFPGMDPYLEGHLWPDVHQALAYEIRRRLAPLVRPRYLTRLAITNYVDYDPSPEIGIIYPDIEVLKRRSPDPSSAPFPSGGVAVAEPSLPSSATEAIDVPAPAFQGKAVSVEVYDSAENRLVTGIEILSPINKRQPDLQNFQQKYAQLRNAQVHVIVIDLLRRGQRPITSSDLPDSSYLVTLTRAGSQVMKAWPIELHDSLPVIPVPLWSPDEDVFVNLGEALATIYDVAGYDLSIDYGKSPPPPELSAQQTVVVKEILELK